MATISQVANDENFEVFESNTIIPSQKSKTSSLPASASLTTFAPLKISKELSSPGLVSDLKINSLSSARSIEDIIHGLDLIKTQNELRSPICTIDEVFDDLELPTTPPPPPPVCQAEETLSSAEQKVNSISTIDELPNEEIPQQLAVVLPPIPESSPVSGSPSISKSNSPAKPKASKRSSASKRSAPQKMSLSNNVFCKETVCLSSELCPSKVSNDNSPKASSKVMNSVHLPSDRSSGSVSPTPTASSTTTSSGVISTNHYERLIEELKCPGCAYPMKAPIKLCATGHSICQHCTTVLMLCPLCKEPFIELRSLTLEALCSKAHFRCSNAAAGCAVRLQIDLLNWHEKQCIWKSMKCFMGRVWGGCTWTGREAGWKDHLETVHSDKVFTTSQVDLIWNLNGKIQPLAGYYVFEVYDELFNFYQVYDRDRILFTMTVTSTVRDRKQNFAYEVEIFHKHNEALVMTQRFPVHSEYDKDILLDGTCVCVSLTDLARLIGQDKILNFRVRLQEVKSPRKGKPPRKASRKHPIDFQKTDIEGANLKCVPAGVIVTRKLDDNPIDRVKDNDKEKDLMKDEETASSDDPEFEAFIEKNWGTPQMNFNRKYLKSSSSKESSSSSSSSVVNEGAMNGAQACEVTRTKSKMQNVTSSLRKSFRSLKTDIIDLKKPFTKKSPEKKESLIKK